MKTNSYRGDRGCVYDLWPELKSEDQKERTAMLHVISASI